jgi:predicted dehydrogenase
MAKYKVGAVGLSRGRGLVHALATHPDVKIAALCDLDQEVVAVQAANFGVEDAHLYTQFHEFINDPVDIVVVATPIEFHAEQCIEAMESGKHVLCEQTAAYSVDDCARLVDTVKRTEKIYMMGENYCYFHYIREWQQWVKQGRLGEIFYAEGEYLHEIQHLLVDPETGKRYWRSRRAPIWYCAHTLGPLLTLMDDRIVRATGMHADRHMFPDESIAFLDMELGLFKTQKGAMIKILRSQAAYRHHEMIFYSLYGTKGFVENGREGGWGATRGRAFFIDEMTKKEGSQEIDCPTVDVNAPPEAQKGGHGTSEYYMIRDFMDSIEANQQPSIDVTRAVDFTIPGLLAHESAMRGGVWLDVPLFHL